jgi:hypothetical protein
MHHAASYGFARFCTAMHGNARHAQPITIKHQAHKARCDCCLSYHAPCGFIWLCAVLHGNARVALHVRVARGVACSVTIVTIKHQAALHNISTG